MGVTAQTIGFQLNEFSWNRVLFILSVLYRCFEMTAAHTLTHSSVDTPHRITGFLFFILLPVIIASCMCHLQLLLELFFQWEI